MFRAVLLARNIEATTAFVGKESSGEEKTRGGSRLRSELFESEVEKEQVWSVQPVQYGMVD